MVTCGQPLHATYDEAVERYGKNLPTKDDWQELLDNVPYVWDKKHSGLLFVAHNAAGVWDVYDVGLSGSYWLAANSEDAWTLVRMKYTQITAIVAPTSWQSVSFRKEVSDGRIKLINFDTRKEALNSAILKALELIKE